ncbi:MAG: lysophospholipid transporter LplT [Rubrivivax sp.]
MTAPIARSSGLAALLAAQFFSALADHVLLIVAIALLVQQAWSEAWTPALKIALVVAYVVFAPWVGPLADAIAKPRLMMLTNALKAAAVVALFAGLVNAPVAMLLVGLGAAAYAPAKYGLVTELVPPSRLVAASAWLEGLTVCAALLGTVLGGLLIGPHFARWTVPAGIEALPAALLVVLQFYAIAAVLNLVVPDSGVRHRIAAVGSGWRWGTGLLRDHVQAQTRLWRDPQAGLSMAVTVLLWGVAATLQFVVLRWAQDALDLRLDEAAVLQGIVAVGVVLGAAGAGRFVRLHSAPRWLPLGIVLGVLVPAVAWIDTMTLAVPALLLCGICAGWLIVPMNALLQHRGQVLLSTGRSVAVQHFNENASVLLTLAAYAVMLACGWSTTLTMVVLGGWITLSLAAVAGCWRATWRRTGDASMPAPQPGDAARPA